MTSLYLNLLQDLSSKEIKARCEQRIETAGGIFKYTLSNVLKILPFCHLYSDKTVAQFCWKYL